ncbi:MAG: alpha/beta hydrolase-fold protein [Candidatus Acidiferrum sp.]
MSGKWLTHSIEGVPVAAFVPEGLEPRFGLVFLNDPSHQTPRLSPAFESLFDELRAVCFCPPGDHSWWTDRIWTAFHPNLSAENFAVERLLPFIRENFQLKTPAIGLFGFGMGGQGALRLAFKHPTEFPAVAGIASTLEYHELYGQGLSLDSLYDSKEQCRQDTAILHIHPSHYPPHIFYCVDPDDGDWYRGNDRLNEKMNALGVPHEIDFTTRAGGHGWKYCENMAEKAIRFVVAGLLEQSRRLL